eukprot:365621-Chlamydomonas_euryale.AAC.5
MAVCLLERARARWLAGWLADCVTSPCITICMPEVVPRDTRKHASWLACLHALSKCARKQTRTRGWGAQCHAPTCMHAGLVSAVPCTHIMHACRAGEHTCMHPRACMHACMRACVHAQLTSIPPSSGRAPPAISQTPYFRTHLRHAQAGVLRAEVLERQPAGAGAGAAIVGALSADNAAGLRREALALVAGHRSRRRRVHARR